MAEKFEDYDYVVFDSVPNDEHYLGFTGSVSFENSVLYEMLTTIAARTKLIILGFVEERHFARASSTYHHRAKLAQSVGAQFIGIRELVEKYGLRLGDRELPLFETDAHPQQIISWTLGQVLGEVIDAGKIRFESDVPNRDLSGNFYSVHPRDCRHTGELVHLENSLIKMEMVILTSGGTLALPGRGGSCLGFYLDKLGTRCFVKLEGDGQRRAKEYWYTASSDKFEIRFIPIRNGFPVEVLSVLGDRLPFERSAYSSFSHWPNTDHPARLSLSTMAFWSGAVANVPMGGGGSVWLAHNEIDRILEARLLSARTRGPLGRNASLGRTRQSVAWSW